MCGNVHDKNCWRVSQAEDTRSIFKAEVSSVYTQTQTNTLLDVKATASHRFCNGDENISVRRSFATKISADLGRFRVKNATVRAGKRVCYGLRPETRLFGVGNATVWGYFCDC